MIGKQMFILVVVVIFLCCEALAADGLNTISIRKEVINASLQHCKPNYCKPIIKEIVDNFAVVQFKCIVDNCETSTAFLKKSGSTWIIVEEGTSIEPADLVNDGFPKYIANKYGDGYPVK